MPCLSKARYKAKPDSCQHKALADVAIYLDIHAVRWMPPFLVERYWGIYHYFYGVVCGLSKYIGKTERPDFKIQAIDASRD